MISERDERLVEAFVGQAERGVGFISQAQLDDGWERLGNATSTSWLPTATRRRALRVWLAGFATASVLAAAGVLFYRATPTAQPVAPLHYVLEGKALAHENVVSSLPGEPAALRFSDASRIDLGPSTRLHVDAMDARGAQVVLLEGTVDVDVRHRANTSWQFAAGPFRIAVKGTAFRLAFNAKAGTVSLHMTRGLVEVAAPPDRKLAVRAGESLELRTGGAGAELPASSEAAVAPAPDERVPEPAARPVMSEPTRRLAPRSAARATEPAGVRAAPPPLSWSALVAQGSFSVVVAEAERRGIDTVLAQASAADLSAFADSARYTRRHELAQKALLAIRARFAGSEPAKDASFFLGRLAEASSRQPEAALGWYDTYLREAPRGLYASETLGREMTLLAPAVPARARQVAQAYLRRFPHGPQAGLARSLLESE
jgi:hypothetical protein